MKSHSKYLLIGILNLLFLPACQNSNNPINGAINTPTGVYTDCKEPHPEMCTQEFRPVCAKVDTGVRCITTPCPSSENKTYSNACTACSNAKVYGFWKNACPE